MANMVKKHIVSMGWGVNSTAMLVYLVQNDLPLDGAIFADTGGEIPETYQYIEEVGKPYLETHDIPYWTVKAPEAGTLEETCLRRKVIPSRKWRWSTRDFKVYPIHRFYGRELGGQINQYLGISYDELHRMKQNGEPDITNIYPLVDARITRSGCRLIIQEAGLAQPVRSGCYFCPFAPLSRWDWLLKTHPDLYLKSIEMEENSKHFPEDPGLLTGRKPLRDVAQDLEEQRSLEFWSVEQPCEGHCEVY